MNLTDEQRAAVEYADDYSASVSASAGSGKTAVLVEHIAKLISDKENVVPADKIAAVTFTEKAAAELRQRLEKRVRELMAENPRDDFFRDQLIRLSSAHISTISSFCLGIVRENLRYLPHLSEDFTVCDEVKSKQLSKEAMEYTLENIYTEYSTEQQREIFTLLGGESDITAKAEQLDKFLSNIPDPEGWIKEQTDIFSDEKLYFLHYEKKGARLFTRYVKEAEAFEGKLSLYEDKAKTQVKNIRELLEGLKKLKEPISALCDMSRRKEMHGLALALPAGVELKDPLNKDIDIKKMTARMDSCRKLALRIFEDKENREKCSRSFRLLCEIRYNYAKRLKYLKEKEKVFFFSDLERYALQVLSEGAANYGENNFRYIIVDEFQDSNDIQFEIFRLLSKTEKNLYFVGDVKQSIYKFRNANPDIFAGCLANPLYKKLSLNSNFRSSESVINTVNLCFGKNMPYEFAKGDWEDMRAARGIKATPENRSELVIINSTSGQENREPLYIAQRIEAMVNEGFAVHGKGNVTRPCGYGDFAVLLRNNNSCAIYRKIFEERGIPCVSIGDKAFTDLTEVNITLSVLETVLHPNDDLSSATALMSPAYGFTAEDMAALRLLGNGKSEKEKITLYKSLSLAAEQNTPLGKKAERFLKDIRLLRKKASDCVTEELIRNIYRVTETDRLMSVGGKGRERRENLRLLLHYAKGYPRANDFLAMIKNISRNKLEMSQAVVKEQEERSVKIMTIHSSKGLQYPIVFLSNTNGTVSGGGSDNVFDYDRKNGIGISLCDYNKKYFINTLSRQLLRDTERDKEKGEELRLLYVALTRAEEKLIITAKAGVKPDKDTGEIIESSYPVFRVGNTFSFFYDVAENEPNAFEMIRIPSAQEFTAAGANATAAAVPLPDFKEAAKRIGYKYPYGSAVKTPAKFTATALGVNAEGGEREDTVSTAFYMGLPLFMKEGHALTPKERGDVYHKVMEKLNFSAGSAQSELERLEKEGEITSQERAVVETDQLQSFLDSPLCKRANAAQKVYREFPLFTTINAVGTEEAADNEDLSFIQGIADMFFVENGEIVLADYKTNRNTTAEKLTAEYQGQLKIYKKALEEMLGMRVKECMLFSFSLKKEIPVNLS